MSDEAKPRKMRRRVVALFVLVVLLVILAIDLVVGALTISVSQSNFRCRHPYFHHGFLANVETETVWADRRYQMATNSLGLRDQSRRTVAGQADRHRLLVIGDSFTEGLGVSFEDSFCGCLSKALGDDVELLNAAAVSYSPKLYYLKSKHLIEQRQLEFDELLVMIDISDIQDETFYESFEGRQQFSLQSRADGVLFRRSFLYHTAARWLDPRRRISNRFEVENTADFDVWINSAELPQKLDKVERFSWTIHRATFEDWGRRGLDLAVENMDQLIDLCGKHQIDVRIGVYPSPYQIFASDRDSIQVKHWQKFCVQRNIPFVNLFPAFINDSFRGPRQVYDRYFIPQDVHWNEAGHQLVADELAKFLNAEEANSQEP